MCVYAYTHNHTHAHAHTHTHVHTCTRTRMHTHTHTHAHAHAHAHPDTRAHAHIHTLTHTHTVCSRSAAVSLRLKSLIITDNNFGKLVVFNTTNTSWLSSPPLSNMIKRKKSEATSCGIRHLRHIQCARSLCLEIISQLRERNLDTELENC